MKHEFQTPMGTKYDFAMDLYMYIIGKWINKMFLEKWWFEKKISAILIVITIIFPLFIIMPSPLIDLFISLS